MILIKNNKNINFIIKTLVIYIQKIDILAKILEN